MIAIVVALDQLLWRPLLAWAQRFKLETVEGEHEPQSWFHDQLARAWLVERFLDKWWAPFMERLDRRWQIPHAPVVIDNGKTGAASRDWRVRLIVVAAGIGLLYLALSAGRLLATLPLAAWRDIAIGLGATLLRVTAALLLAAAWTIPVGVAIGTRPRFAAVLQPVAQVAASVPATALFPILLLALLHLPGGLNLAAVLLMLLGSQWYLLFNVIAGASAIPRDLRDPTALLRLSPVERWRTLLLPALFPYVVTGAITAVGGAWNASVVAEYVQFGGETHATLGIGAVISHATATGDFALLLAATLAMVVTVVLLNRLFWQPLYRLAEARYRME